MPISDYECPDGHITEHIFKIADKPKHTRCSKCGKQAKSIITVANVYMGNQDVDWAKEWSKEFTKGNSPECDRFIDNPNRETARGMLKKHDLRPVERGERYLSPGEARKAKRERSDARMKKHLMKAWRDANRITM